MAELVCEGDERRRLVREHPRFNGLDYLEVSDDQRHLSVYFLDTAPADLVPENVRITGGRRVTDIRVLDVDVCRSEDPERDDCLAITVDRPGDFSCYRLCIVQLDERGRGTDRIRSDFDPRYACIDFSFKAGCPTDLDCLEAPCPPQTFPEPDINYLAKDYASFRQLLHDRLALVMPEWRERHVPDLGIALVEVLAYVGDHLSYQQDAVATEAYLDTARLRISVRRHARLVDYHMHEGCNARAWVSLETDTDRTIPSEGLAFVTSLTGHLVSARTVVAPVDLDRVAAEEYEWFEPVLPSPFELRAAHNEIRIYTWGDTGCCLPAGTTRATLVDGYAEGQGTDDGYTEQNGDYGKYGGEREPEERPRLLNLRPGQFLLLEEVLGPRTGLADDADPTHRHVVRLTSAEPTVDQLTGQPLVEVEWGPEDALPLPLCVSVVGPPPDCTLLDPASVARGNVVLVDHGRTVGQAFPEVPTVEVQPPCADGCPDRPILVAGRFRPTLDGAPLTFTMPLLRWAPAVQVIEQDPRQAAPAVELEGRDAGRPGGVAWWVRPDLLSSSADDRHAVVEVDDDGRGHLRFGDDVLGRAPEAGTVFSARYRVGNGPAGNVAAETIAHLVSDDPLDGIELVVRNPLAARGGTAPEPMVNVKTVAPASFRRQRQRAVTAADYAELAQRDAPEAVQRAAGDLRWTGSWYEVRVAVDALGRATADEALLRRVRTDLERYRRIAHDVRVMPAENVPLDIALLVCVGPQHSRADVLSELLDRFSDRVLADGSKGLFHPDSLAIGDSVYVSRLVAEAASVAGVDNVVVTRLRRYDEPDGGALARGVLWLAPHEIARLDNDLSFPDNGVLQIDLRGGR